MQRNPLRPTDLVQAAISTEREESHFDIAFLLSDFKKLIYKSLNHDVSTEEGRKEASSAFIMLFKSYTEMKLELDGLKCRLHS